MTPKRWDDDENFWQVKAEFMFTPARWEQAPSEVDRILALLELPEAAAVLDACCGPGRHSLELARRGFRVTGVDRTTLYLEEARRRAAAEGLEIEFLEQDMRDFRRDEVFDAALNMFTSFGYFEDPADDRRVVENLYASLRPGGKLLLDVMGKEVLARIFTPRHWSQSGETLVLTESEIQRDWSWIKNHEIYLVGDRRYEFELTHRLYSAAELKALLLDCGFQTAAAFGDLAGAPYDNQAGRLVVLAVK